MTAYTFRHPRHTRTRTHTLTRVIKNISNYKRTTQGEGQEGNCPPKFGQKSVNAQACQPLCSPEQKYFSFQPVLHDWFNKGRGMCFPVHGVVHIKDPLLLIGKSNSCSGGTGFPLSLPEWSFTICPTPYNRK